MKKIFISGPMTGMKDYNIPTFDRWEFGLKKLGYEVINPANIARRYKVSEVVSKKEVFDRMVEEELEVLRGCDYIFLINGWHKSKGSRRELRVALEANIEIKLQEEIQKEIDDDYCKRWTSNTR